MSSTAILEARKEILAEIKDYQFKYATALAMRVLKNERRRKDAHYKAAARQRVEAKRGQ